MRLGMYVAAAASPYFRWRLSRMSRAAVRMREVGAMTWVPGRGSGSFK